MVLLFIFVVYLFTICLLKYSWFTESRLLPDFWRGITYIGSWPSGNIKDLRKVISFPHSCDLSVNRAHSEPLNVHVACPSHNAGWSDDEDLIANTKRDYFCGCPGPRMLNGQIGAISRLLWCYLLKDPDVSRKEHWPWPFTVTHLVLWHSVIWKRSPKDSIIWMVLKTKCAR